MNPLILEGPIMECRNDKCHIMGIDGICHTLENHWTDMITFGKCERCGLGINWDKVDHDYQEIKDQRAVDGIKSK